MTVRKARDMGPVCCIMFGIVQECRLMGEQHRVTVKNKENHRKQIVLSPLHDDFIHVASLLNMVFGTDTLLFNSWNFGLTFGTTMVPGKHNSAIFMSFPSYVSLIHSPLKSLQRVVMALLHLLLAWWYPLRKHEKPIILGLSLVQEILMVCVSEY